MARRNRPSVRIYLNRAQEGMIQDLCVFYDKNPQEVMRLALEQLHMATTEIQKKLREEWNASKQSESSPASASPDGSEDTTLEGTAPTAETSQSNAPADLSPTPDKSDESA